MDKNFDITNSTFNRKIAEWEIEHEDIFHLKNMYKSIYQWFQENEYTSFDEHEDDKYETLYFQKQNDSGMSEHHIWWRTQKKPNDSDYVKYVICLDYQTLIMQKTKIDYKGHKMSTNQGDVILRCRSFVMLDYNRKWRDHWFLSIMQRWFWRYLFRDQWLTHKETVWSETYSLQNHIKQFLELKTASERPESWFPDMKP